MMMWYKIDNEVDALSEDEWCDWGIELEMGDEVEALS